MKRVGKFGITGVTVVLGILLVVFSLTQIGYRLAIDLSGIITKAEKVQSEKGPLGNPQRYFTEYLVLHNATGETNHYRAKGNDVALSRNLEVGSEVEKKKWRLSYSVDGVVMEDFPTLFYGAILLVGSILLVVGATTGKRKNDHQKDIETSDLDDLSVRHKE